MQLRIQWDPPIEPNGLIIGYNLSITTHEADSSITSQIELDGFARNHIFNVSRLCRNYTVNIQAVNSAGLSPTLLLSFSSDPPGSIRFYIYFS